MEKKNLKTNVELVDVCDSFPYPNTDAYSSQFSALYTLVWQEGKTSTPIGYLLPSVVEALIQVPISIRGEVSINDTDRTLSAFQLPTETERSAVIASTLEHWRAGKTFEVLSGWRSELYPVYGPKNELLYSLERSAATLFGVVTYGVHLTAYTPSPNSSHGIKIWVPRRSYKKQTYGGMLDNTVAGGMATGENPLGCVIREAGEEASLDAEYVERNIEPAGQLTYVYIREKQAGGEVGTIQPECQYVYDLKLEEGMQPTPNDGEVHEFYLWTVEEVKEHLAKAEFKPNCAACMLDFLGRKGMLDGEKEGWTEVNRRLHRTLEFPGPHQEAKST